MSQTLNRSTKEMDEENTTHFAKCQLVYEEELRSTQRHHRRIMGRGAPLLFAGRDNSTTAHVAGQSERGFAEEVQGKDREIRKQICP